MANRLTMENCQQIADWSQAAARPEVLAVMSRIALRALPVVTRSSDSPLEVNLFHCLRSALISSLQGYTGGKIDPEVIHTHDVSSAVMEAAFAEKSASIASLLEMFQFATFLTITGDIWLDEKNGDSTLPEMASATLDIAFELTAGDVEFFNSVNFDLHILRTSRSSTRQLMNQPLWKDRIIPPTVLEDYNEFNRILSMKPQTWKIWQNWFDGVVQGGSHLWPKMLEIAKIDFLEWDDGPNNIASFIKRSQINAVQNFDFGENSRPIKVNTHYMLSDSVRSELVALGLSAHLIENIEAYHTLTGENFFPEPFSALLVMPGTLSLIAEELRRSDPEKLALEKKVRELTDAIFSLEESLNAAKSQLKERFVGTAAESAGKSIGDWKMYAALFAVVGLWAQDSTVNDALSGISSAIIELFGNNGSE